MKDFDGPWWDEYLSCVICNSYIWAQGYETKKIAFVIESGLKELGWLKRNRKYFCYNHSESEIDMFFMIRALEK